MERVRRARPDDASVRTATPVETRSKLILKNCTRLACFNAVEFFTKSGVSEKGEISLVFGLLNCKKVDHPRKDVRKSSNLRGVEQYCASYQNLTTQTRPLNSQK